MKRQKYEIWILNGMFIQNILFGIKLLWQQVHKMKKADFIYI